MNTMKEYGQFIIQDPDVCHGQAIFRGTRVLVSDVLDQVAEGLDWSEIIAQWRGSITEEAIKEALKMAKTAFNETNPPISA